MKHTLLLKLVLFSLFHLAGPSLLAQNFEGKMVFKSTCKSKVPGISDEKFTGILGNRYEYYVKDGFYKNVTNGTAIEWQLYRPDENKLYTKRKGDTAVVVIDAGTNPDPLVKAEINRGVITIMGTLCDELILTNTISVQKYYFSSKYPVDPTLFLQHQYGNYNEFVSRAKALALKSVMESKQFIWTLEVMEVVPGTLDPSFFALPPNVK